jgi:hypothetical protein
MMRRHTVPASILLAALVLALGVGACSGNDDDASVGLTDDAGGTEGDALAAGDTESGAGARDETTATTVALASAKPPGGRQEIVYTGEISLRVRDVERALADATRSVEAAGGSLFRQRSDLDGRRAVTAVFKVPPERFTAVLDALGELGTVRQRQVDASDVTGQVVDLEARAAAARTSVERLRALLAESGTVGDLLTVERELATREGQLESLDGQLAALRDRVERATVTVRFNAPARPAADEPRDLPGFLRGLSAGAGAFRDMVVIGGGALGFALPFLALAAVAALPVIVRRRQRHAGA